MKNNTNKIALGIVLFLGVLYLCFSLYYLLHSRAALLNDYCAATPVFYRKAIFTSSVFTDAIKQQGNIMSLMAFPLVAVLGLLLRPYFSLNFTSIFAAQWLKIRGAALWMTLLILLTSILFIYGNSLQPVCTDEAFSIVNFAQQPLSHLLTYYPIPNNHIFFNLLNHFAGKISGDYLLSGRMLSGVFYVLLICGNFLFIQKFIQNKFISFLCTALLAQQLMVWGFGAQARGYSLYYLLQWAAFVFFYYYFFEEITDKRPLLLPLIVCNALGLYTIPSFLYFILFEVLAALLLVIYHRQIFLQFWIAIFTSVLVAFLLYLPIFCYSGLASVFANKYVAGGGFNSIEILQQSLKYFTKDIAEITFGFSVFKPMLSSVLFIIPLVYFFLFQKKAKGYLGIAVVATLTWFAVFCIVFVTKQVFIFRAIGFQMHLSLLVFLMFLVVVLQNVIRQKFVQNSVFFILVTAASIKVLGENKNLYSTVLYGQNTIAFINELNKEKLLFSSDKSVWFSDESFMFNFLIDKDMPRANFDCAFDCQDFLVLSEDDKPNLLIDLEKYAVKQKVSCFVIYQKK